MNAMMPLETQAVFADQFGRQKRKLRISVTDRCNFKCVYCMPEHPEWVKKQDLLSFEELYQFCHFMVQQGIEHIRITGGEPLMRQGVVHFIEQLQQLKKIGLKRISMTTNAHYLKKYAEALKNAGLDDLNISLDSLDAEQFKQLTQKELAPVLAGISAAQEVGLPIKINTVLMKDMNDDQILPLAKWSIQQNIVLRFIEFMPLDGDQKWSAADVVSEQQILTILATEFDVQIQEQSLAKYRANPARQYLISHSLMKNDLIHRDLCNKHPIGIISTISHSFCGDCDRIRLTAQGELYNCLFAPKGLALKAEIKALSLASLLSATSTIEKMPESTFENLALLQKIGAYIWKKEQGYDAIQARTAQQASRKISMHMLGG
ncbi:GTP 3',8-cyclase MoaA [Acinetobacter sp. ANC 3832]|uniref:GTP 3',8-cyclase MoaA n=1 Tax=Acinetobacter sp. ANC 3832 TaxID=1977874 RepID=UPI000A34FF69|nr:GTP 3',8-cyclase MoaA [Acinetobacter sp. ANC 3832]OTG93873.1 GTP 3',8-cyclase MoaA [Acinetobacter sp. ANC 3832]